MNPFMFIAFPALKPLLKNIQNTKKSLTESTYAWSSPDVSPEDIHTANKKTIAKTEEGNKPNKTSERKKPD